MFKLALLPAPPCTAGDTYVESGKLATKFCASPAFKQLQCGWASQSEQDATLGSQCLYCGTLFQVPPKQLPATLTSHPSYNQYSTQVMSLACKGRVVVRSVFKITKQPPVAKTATLQGTDCTNSRLVYIEDTSAAEGGAASPIVRCELQLPSGSGSEVERALRAKEVNCHVCDYCSTGAGCPSKAGVWYSDSFTTQAAGCGFDPKKGYTAHRVGININPNTEVLLAKFEVCSSPNCFNQASEDGKLKLAKACKNGKCA